MLPATPMAARPVESPLTVMVMISLTKYVDLSADIVSEAACAPDDNPSTIARVAVNKVKARIFFSSITN
jgi:hypothetical protein